MPKTLLKHLARFFLPVYTFKSGELTVAFAGYSPIKRYYFGRFPLRPQEPTPFFSGRVWYRSLPGLVGKKCDLLFAEAGGATSVFLRSRQGWLIPEWTQMHIDITRPLQELRKRGVSDFANVERYIRKFDLTYQLSDTPESIRRFYDGMYLPYLKSRHGEEALIESFDDLLKERNKLELLTVFEQGEPISGALIERMPGYIHQYRVGIIGGDESLNCHGAIGSLYYFTVVEGQKTGCSYIDVGGTRPFLTDGITQSKLRHSASFVTEYSPKNEHLWFACSKASAPARQFIETNPFIYWDDAFRLRRSDTGDPASESTPSGAQVDAESEGGSTLPA